MKKLLCVALTAGLWLLTMSPGQAHAWWPSSGTDGGYGGWGFWPGGMWPYGGPGGARQAMSSYRAQEDALRSEGIQRANQQAQQLRADQQSDAARRGADMHQWSAIVSRSTALQTQVATAERFDEMRAQYLADRDRPVAPEEEQKRFKAWVDSIRRQVKVAYADIFTPRWMDEHPVIDPRVKFRNPNPYHWWTASPWKAITSWVLGSWPEPAPLYFGQNVVVKDGMVYIDGKQAAGSADFAAHAIAIARAGEQALSAPPSEREKMEWLPLGVFALSHEAKGAPTMFVQLAVDKNGVIAGTYFNAATEQTQSIQGALERSSSRAAWSVADHRDTVLEAGVLNLTMDELPVLVHFGTERSQRWLLTRMFPARSNAP